MGFKCIECGDTFEVPDKALADPKRSFAFCSHGCYATHRSKTKKGGVVVCETCKLEFWVTAARIRQTAKNGNAIRFCSHKCYIKTGDLNPFWGKKHKRETVLKFLSNPNRHIFASGRNNPNYKRYEYSPHKRKNPDSARRSLRLSVKKCERCEWGVEPLILQIHHKDRNRRNNERKNIDLLCPNCHELEHFHSKDGRWRKYKKERKPPPSLYIEL